MNHVELSNRAKRDLKRMDRRERERMVRAMATKLEPEPPPENADLDHLVGHQPWMRLREGPWRIIFRPLSRDEIEELRERGEKIPGDVDYLVDRFPHRSDLETAVRKLPNFP